MNKNALIVDDSRLACRIMENMLDTLGIQAVSVHSAAQALDYLNLKTPDIIFLDHSMPDKDGFETIKLIKDNPKTAKIPVMMYTAKQGEEYVDKAMALGAVDVLPKGMEKDVLSKALKKMGFIAGDVTEIVAEPAEPNEKPVQKTSTIDDSELKPSVEQPIWQTFWQRQAKPFLTDQKEQHSDEIQYTTSQLGLKINRNMHQTLEQFEHALVSRIEANNDYKDAQHEIKNKKILNTVISVGAILLFVQLLIFWQLYQNNKVSKSLLQNSNQQQSWQQQFDEQLSQFNQNLEASNEQPEGLVNLPDEVTSNAPQSISLMDDFGGLVAQNLYLSNQIKDEYSGVTTSGYQFIVNTHGKVGFPLETRYFQTNDCSDDVFIASENAMIYQGHKGRIWYVDKLALAVDILVASTMNMGGECIASDDEVMSLKPLLISDYLETGIDESQVLRLDFNE
ncbi:MAG: hypothetical protein DRQ47_00080 [Gammaproteobacteria bacterium]|nr:MAG: hypothetical protein DRQ47_00080 [Gammaproteobacteria bacterium]